jgi:hypothetical protein
MLEGESSSQKASFVYNEFEDVNATIGDYDRMNERRANEEISVEEWTAYLNDYAEARMRETAINIFLERTMEFEELLYTYEVNAPPQYIYEYGWNTVFRYFRMPDFFLLFVAVFLSSLSFAGEVQQGAMPLLRSAKNGRSELFFAKVAALASVVLALAVVAGLMDMLVFELRFSLASNGGAPIYSIANFEQIPIPWTLRQGQIAVLLYRAVGTLAVCLLCMELSIILNSSVNSVFLVMIFVSAPLMMGDLFYYLILLVPTGMLLGVNVLQLYQQGVSAAIWLVPLLASALLVGVVAYPAYKKYVAESR